MTDKEITNADGSRNWEANILFDNIKRLEAENAKLKQTLQKIKKIAETKTMPSCLKPDCNCDICKDEITEYGQKCIRNGIRQILNLINESEVEE